MKKLCLVIFMLVLAGGSAFAEQDSDKKVFKRYSVKSGMILYDINTTGISPGLTTQTIGVSRLVFDDWGAKELKEDDATEVQSGDFNDERKRRAMSKIDHGTIYTVDFDENVTYQTRDRNLDLAIAQKVDLSNESVDILKEMNATKVGTENIAGYLCDVWKLKDQTICLHRGIPLKITIETPGFRSTRTAQVVALDKPISPKEFSLPGYAVMVDEDYISDPSATTRTMDYMTSVRDLNKKIKTMNINLNDPNATITPDQEKEIINALGENYLKKQKNYLPKLMVALQKAKACIQGAQNARVASTCMEPANRINVLLGDKTSEYDYSMWSDMKKLAIIHAITKEMNYLKVTVDCVTKHGKTTDVIICTEGSLDSRE